MTISECCLVGMLVVTIWLELCSSYSSSCHHHLQPCSNKIQNGDILERANLGQPGKWLKPEREIGQIIFKAKC